MKVEVVAECYLLEDPTRVGVYHRLAVIIKSEGDLLEFLNHNVYGRFKSAEPPFKSIHPYRQI